ncbi:TRAP transporter small permease [Conservatibacter flavescens]|uniref:TRAP transporter small permease protein n=1 Tax=Conservatibacter flavescens TaxID=28161 RepID=A0A2M8RZF0_9PAST|nr:TRAP transporter small permease [Conservatibacter flavescens]PJG84244.1 C4-dicarboxylate ABC transporter permease [Conservatibacter flavescens]
MNTLARYSTKILETLVVIILAIMSTLVFLNVVLRYGFNSSISVTEEVARYLFVWLSFLGAILAFNENQHVSVNVLVDKLSPLKRRVLRLITDGLMLFCCYLVFDGSMTQFQLNWDNIAPISGIPTGITFLASVIASAAIGLLLVLRMFANLTALAKGDK